MTVPNWTTYSYSGTALPQAPQKGYNESSGALILRTPMDAGPAKMRRRGKSPDQLNVQFVMTTAQVSTLNQFINTQTYGIYRYKFTHPRSNALVDVRMIPQQGGSLYTSTYIAPGYWNVAIQLEVLP